MDRKELADWFDTRRAAMHEVARRIVGSTAEADDIVQDACVRACLLAGDPVLSIGAWMTTTIRHLAFDRLRHRQVTTRFAADSIDDTALPTEDIVALRLRAAEAVRAIVETLGEAEAVLLILQIVFDEDHASLARRAGKSVGALRVLIHRARQRIKRSIAAGARPPVAAERDRIERTFAVCWEAIASHDAALLHALLTNDPVARTDAALAPPVRIATMQVAGRHVLVLRQGDALLCALPVDAPAQDRIPATLVG